MPLVTTYSQWKTTIQTMLAIDSSDVDWPNVENAIIDAGELRCYREVDFQATSKIEQSSFGTTAPGNALVSTPSDLLIIRAVDYFTPVNTNDTNGGTRVPLEPRDESWIKDYWPARSLTAPPKFYAVLNPTTLLVAPTPDAAYTIEMSLSYRPTPLSSSNTTTLLTLNAPDMFLYATLVFAAGYLKNFGAQSDNPQVALSWEGEYQKAKSSVVSEEKRKKAQGRSDDSASDPGKAVRSD